MNLRALGSTGNMSSEMGLVRRLIPGETHITINTENAILGAVMRDASIEIGNTIDECVDKTLEFSPRFFVTLLIGFKPVAVIVTLKIPEKLEGAFADIVIMDLDRVKDMSTPLDPCVYPDGIDHVIVNGTHVVEDMAHTGEKPGKILYRE